jgi:hypothetical protein
MKRVHGVVMMGVGAVLVLVGAISLLTDGDDDTPEAATTTFAPATTMAPATTTATTAAPPTATTEPATTPAATTATTTTTTTTTATAPPTTTTVATETVEDFIEAYAQATETDDVDFFFDRLHPVVLARTDADQCRAFIAADIVTLEDYRLNGTVAGPRAVSFDTPEGPVMVDELYEAPVSFMFSGQSFDVVAAFAPVDGQMRWLTECS